MIKFGYAVPVRNQKDLKSQRFILMMAFQAVCLLPAGQVAQN